MRHIPYETGETTRFILVPYYAVGRHKDVGFVSYGYVLSTVGKRSGGRSSMVLQSIFSYHQGDQPMHHSPNGLEETTRVILVLEYGCGGKIRGCELSTLVADCLLWMRWSSEVIFGPTNHIFLPQGR
jgi:hypothetical protein